MEYALCASSMSQALMGVLFWVLRLYGLLVGCGVFTSWLFLMQNPYLGGIKSCNPALWNQFLYVK